MGKSLKRNDKILKDIPMNYYNLEHRRVTGCRYCVYGVYENMDVFTITGIRTLFKTSFEKF